MSILESTQPFPQFHLHQTAGICKNINSMHGWKTSLILLNKAGTLNSIGNMNQMAVTSSLYWDIGSFFLSVTNSQWSSCYNKSWGPLLLTHLRWWLAFTAHHHMTSSKLQGCTTRDRAHTIKKIDHPGWYQDTAIPIITFILKYPDLHVTSGSHAINASKQLSKKKKK